MDCVVIARFSREVMLWKRQISLLIIIFCNRFRKKIFLCKSDPVISTESSLTCCLSVHSDSVRSIKEKVRLKAFWDEISLSSLVNLLLDICWRRSVSSFEKRKVEDTTCKNFSDARMVTNSVESCAPAKLFPKNCKFLSKIPVAHSTVFSVSLKKASWMAVTTSFLFSRFPILSNSS